MTIRDKFLENEKMKRNEEHKERVEYIKSLGERLNKALLDPKFIKKVTPILEKCGAVQFSDVGCLCQGGACYKQKGFTEYCKEATNFWAKEGVYVKFGVDSGLVVDRDIHFGFGKTYPQVKLYGNVEKA